MTISLLGHSLIENSSSLEEDLEKIFVQLITSNDYCSFLIGGYGMFDNLCLIKLKRLKNAYNNFEIIFVTPYLDENYSKLKVARELYDAVIFPPIEKTPLKYAILKRNEWMIINCELVICYIKTLTASRAGKFFILAKKLNKKIINLARNTTLIDL